MKAPLTSTFGELVREGVLEIGDGFRAKLEELGGDGPFFLRAGALTDIGFDWNGLDSFHRTVQVDGKRGWPNDVVITTKGNSIGRVGRVPVGCPEFVYSPHLSYWRVRNSEKVDSAYLYYWSRSEEFKRQLARLGFGTDMAPYLSLRDQLGIRITLPSLAIQRAASAILESFDDKIAANDRATIAAEKLAVAMVQSVGSKVSLSALATQSTSVCKPEDFAESVAHFSLPAFDIHGMPEIVSGASIKSNKFVLSQPCVLFSKLNPRIPRIWNVQKLPGDLALASTEFVVLVPNEIDSSVLWAALSQPEVSGALQQKVAGTSGSHQRIRPAELIDLAVKDVRTLGVAQLNCLRDLGALCQSYRSESLQLARTRDELLLLLMSGALSLIRAEEKAKGVV